MWAILGSRIPGQYRNFISEITIAINSDVSSTERNEFNYGDGDEDFQATFPGITLKSGELDVNI